MSKETYDSLSRLIAFSLKVVGILGIVFIPAFWALTGRVEFAFLPFFGTLAGVGQGLDVLREIRQQVAVDTQGNSTTNAGGGRDEASDANNAN